MTRVDGAGLQRSASPQRSTPATLRIIGAPGSLVGTTTNRAAILPDRIEVSRRADRIPTLMKTLAALLSAVAHPFQRWNVRLVLWMVVGICVLIAIFTVGFHVLMAAEGREFSWATGIYWTLTVMSTLGFSDITFESDAGRLFSVVVLLTGRYDKHQHRLHDPRDERDSPDRRHCQLDRVGRAAGRALDDAGVPFKIVEKRPERIRDEVSNVLGDAAELDVLQRAGLNDAAAVLVTTHEDDMNVYLTLYCRKLRSDVQIISRATLDRNVSTLHRAGADAVLSYSSLGATAIWNASGHHRTLVVAEGLEVVRLPMPANMAGRTLAQCAVSRETGSHVVATARNGTLEINPDPSAPLPADADLVIIGDEDATRRFLERFPGHRPVQTRAGRPDVEVEAV